MGGNRNGAEDRDDDQVYRETSQEENGEEDEGSYEQSSANEIIVSSNRPLHFTQIVLRTVKGK